MGVFDQINSAKSQNRKITVNFLKTQGFKKCLWGPIYKKKDPHYQAWEKYIETDDWTAGGCLYYFPPEFEGYVTAFNSKGVSPKEHWIGWLNSDASSAIYEGNAANHYDIKLAIDKIKFEIDEFYKII